MENSVENFLKLKRTLAVTHIVPSIIAVSKTHPIESIQPLLHYGHRIFGENKVQEAKDKWSILKSEYEDVQLHLIGSLQTNKVKDAVKIFDVIQTVDRLKLARKLSDELAKQNKQIDCFIQVNTGEEEQKSGIYPKELEEFVALCTTELQLSIKGLMCIPPVGEPAGLHFGLLKNLAEKYGLNQLSMGMSGDYELAASMGATYIRVGSAIFGERKT